MKYYLRKIVGFFVTLFLVSVITFGVFQILPGNPALVILGVDADPAQIAALEDTMNLDMPPLQRYVAWVAGAIKGDLGMSFRYNQPVSQLISNGFSVTAGLAVMTMIMTVAIGLPLGIYLAKHSESRYSLPVSMISQLGLSIPAFCMGIFLISIFSVKLKWFPSLGYTAFSASPVEWLKSMFLPALSITIGSSAVLVRYIKVSIAAQQKQDYVRTAHSKGLSDDVIMKSHVLRNSLIPVITIFGMLTADILGGSIIVENVFSLPGIGKLVSTSISTRDLPLIQGLVLYLAIIVVISNFLVDMMYSVVDPRIRVK